MTVIPNWDKLFSKFCCVHTLTAQQGREEAKEVVVNREHFVSTYFSSKLLRVILNGYLLA